LAEQISLGASPNYKLQQRPRVWADQRAWGEIFRDFFYSEPSSESKKNPDLEYKFKSEWMHHVLEPVLGCLKKNNYPIQIHTLEKDLIYLSALSISQQRQLFISFPVSPISLGILLVVYYAHLTREERDISHTNHATSAKDYVIWIRPKDTGKILNLRTTKSFNIIDQNRYKLNERIACIPACKFDESLKSDRLKVFVVRSLSEANELLKQSNYCSLVVIDDPSGRTYPSPYNYGSEAFKLSSICRQKRIPMVGIVPSWAMRDIEYHEIKNPQKTLLWPIDFYALRSCPADRDLFVSNGILHPIEESYLLLEKKRKLLTDTQVIIQTVNFDTDEEEKIANLFQQAFDLLIDLGKQPHLRSVWGTGWGIWRDISAPVLPFHLLWEQFIERALAHLESVCQGCGDAKALILYNLLNSLARRLNKIKYNPFLEIIGKANRETVIAVENAERAKALEQFLEGRNNASTNPNILSFSELRGVGGDRLIVIGQPKACHREILQTTFFRKIDVLLWSFLSENAKRWWSNLEVDARKWHQKTWFELTQKNELGRYSFSPYYISVQIVTTGQAKLAKSIDVSKLEESFSTLIETGLDSGLTSSFSRNLESYYLIEFEQGLRIRVAPGSKFLVASRKQTHVVAVKELTAGTKVVLFEGMNRDELFAQKAGLLEDNKVNYLYGVQLDGWRKLVRQRVENSDLQTVCKFIRRDTGIPIGEQTIQYNWMSGDDLLSLPREKEHFFWFLHPLARSNFEDFWQKANELRIKRRQLGQIITACAQEGWKERESDEIVFQYQQVFITVGELRDAMQILKVQSSPQLINQRPEYPINRLFSTKGVSNAA
jgi:hypothetical protein